MRMSQGVEWAAHCCLVLDWLGGERPVATARLAGCFELPAPYLNKQLQALVKAGILESVPGARGGFLLARPLEKTTLMDVVAAIEGPEDAFACTEIRQRGAGTASPPSAYRTACGISTAMRMAELEWRRALAARTLAQLRDDTERHAPAAADRTRRWFADH
jgi:Rrf2 family protein